jgi:ribosomal protein S18 acetylase RimI-like enzyme
MVKLHIREFRLDDYDKVVKLWKESGLILRPSDDREGIELKRQRDPDLFLIAENGQEILGVVLGAWDGRRGWINHLAVQSTHRRLGIGTTLIKELENRLIKKGALKVNAQIYQSNNSSLAFFKAMNYEIHSDLIMVGKDLSE